MFGAADTKLLRVTAPDSTSPPRSASSPVRHDIQGLRALAVIAVVVFHAGLALPGGFVGVDIFFVISGFVITASLLREQTRFGRISLRAFYWRRFRRLVPALALVVAVTLILSGLFLSPVGPQQTAAATGLAAMFSLANVAISLTTGDYFDSAAELNPLLHTWTLSVEEQFYLVFPAALVLGIFLLKNVRRSVGIVLVAGTATSFAVTMATPWLLDIYATEFLGFYSPLTRAWEFGVGALVAWWVIVRPPELSRLLARWTYLTGFTLIGLSFTSLSQIYAFPGPITLLPVLGTALVILAGTANPWSSGDPLQARWAVTVGDWSYSIYLWHWPFISLTKLIWPDESAALVLAATVSLVPAIASYYLVEQPLRKKRTRSLQHTLVFVLMTLFAPVTLAIALWSMSNYFDDQMGAATERPAGYTLGCHGPGTVDSPLEVCTFGTDSPPDVATIYLVGDSHAAHFTSGLQEASDSLGARLDVMTASSCPLLDGVSPDSGRDNAVEQCHAWQDKVFDYLDAAPRGVVILGSTDAYWLETQFLASSNGQAVASPDEKLALLESGLAGGIVRLTDAGHEVVVVQSVPAWRGDDDWRLDQCTFWETVSGCNQSMPLAETRSQASDVLRVIEGAARAQGATVVDFADQICPEGLCNTYAGDFWVYRDASHITKDFSATLSPRWVDILKSR